MTWLRKKLKANVRLNILQSNKLENIKDMDQNQLKAKQVCTHEDIIMLIIMTYRVSTPETIQFRSKLGFKQHDLILSKEQSVTSKIAKLFLNEKILLQNSILGYKTD